MEDYIWKVEVLYIFALLVPQNTGSQTPTFPDGRLERPSSWNLTSLREKETKDYSIWIFYPTCPARLPYHAPNNKKNPLSWALSFQSAGKRPLFIMSSEFIPSTTQSESPGNEENFLLLEPKTELYMEKKKTFGGN